MSIRRASVAALATTLLLGGCTSYRGADRLHEIRPTGGADAAQFYGVRQIFADDLKGLLADRRARKQPDTAAMKPLLNSGFSLVRVYCNEYFNEMGRNQRNSAVLRDLIKPITDVVNLVIGLKLLSDTENVNADLVTGFAGLSSAATAGLNVYDRHFLFDNDNIAAVRALTMNGLAKHREAVYQNVPDDVVLAVGQLQDNENICTPAQILSNVREAIKKGEFSTTTTGGGNGTQPPPPNGQNNGTPVPDGSESFTTTPG